MPLIPAKTLAPSRRPYALVPERLTQDSGSFWRCEAIWLGRKKSVTRLSYGELAFWWQGVAGADPFDANNDLDTLKRYADERYGGTPWYVLGEDGSWWVNPAQGTPKPDLDRQQSVKIRLESLMVSISQNDLPDDYDGWYHLVSRRAAELSNGGAW